MSTEIPSLNEIVDAVRHVLREELDRLDQRAQWLDRKEAAKDLGVSVRQTYRLCERGILPPPDLRAGRIVRWRRETVAAAKEALKGA